MSARVRGAVAVAAALLLLPGARAAAAQERGPSASVASAAAGPAHDDPSLLARADSLVEAGAIQESLSALEAQLERAPDDFDARWRAARAAVYLGILASDTDEENRWYRRGMGHADLALAARPDDHDALRWALAAKGNLAVQTHVPENGRLGNAVWDLAHHVLGLWPDDPDAHYALGKLEYELLKLNAVQRLMSRPFQRGELNHLSWSEALTWSQRAVELDPGSALFRLGLADTLWRMDRRAEARAQLEMGRDLPFRTPVDSDFRARAELLLWRIEHGIDPTR